MWILSATVPIINATVDEIEPEQKDVSAETLAEVDMDRPLPYRSAENCHFCP